MLMKLKRTAVIILLCALLSGCAVVWDTVKRGPMKERADEPQISSVEVKSDTLTPTKALAAPFATMTAQFKDYVTATPGPQTAITLDGKPQFIDFFAYWCSPCMEMRPALRRIEEDYAGQITFNYINVDDAESAALVEEYGAYGIPHLVFLSADGEIVKQMIGFQTEESLRRGFEDLTEAESGGG
jgi:thiol-disulfide isomerase/thioredoxin